MVDTSNYSGAPITIPQGDGSSKVYDAGLLCPEAQQAVNMLAFLNQFRQVLNAANQVFSNVVNISALIIIIFISLLGASPLYDLPHSKQSC